MTAQDLSSALISALESNTVSPVSAPNDVTFDLLLAEDNQVSQKLAVKFLRSMVTQLKLPRTEALPSMVSKPGSHKANHLISFLYVLFVLTGKLTH